MDLGCPLVFMSQISWQVCDIFEISNRVCDTSSSNPFYVQTRIFQVTQGPEGLVWINKERAALQAFLGHYKREEGVDVPIFEAGEGGGSPRGNGLLSKGTGSGREERITSANFGD